METHGRDDSHRNGRSEGDSADRSRTISNLRECFNVSIVSNSRLLREGIMELLGEYLCLELVGSYSGNPPPKRIYANPEGHVVLLDSGVGRDAAIAWTQLWCGLRPMPCVMVLELTQDYQLVLDCIEAGARAYTLVGTSPQEVAQAIRLMSNDRVACLPGATANLFIELAEQSANRYPPDHFHPQLTPREREVLDCLTRGYSNQEIANELVVGVRTVKYHVHNILEKLDVSSRHEAAALAERAGWVD